MAMLPGIVCDPDARQRRILPMRWGFPSLNNSARSSRRRDKRDRHAIEPIVKIAGWIAIEQCDRSLCVLGDKLHREFLPVLRVPLACLARDGIVLYAFRTALILSE
jgi:hypothetical protein